MKLQVIAERLSTEEVAGIKQGFDLMDINKQGKINIVELKNGLQKLGHHIPDADLQMLMEAVSIVKKYNFFVFLKFNSYTRVIKML